MQEKITRIFQEVERNEAFKRMFFKKLSETENPIPWFEELRKRGYLDPSNNKNPTMDRDNYTVPYWQALGYLENLAKHITDKPEEIILEKLIDLTNSIIEYKENDQRIENPHTDWMIIKTIFKLPIEKIVANHIEFVEIALLSKFSNTVLISAEIEKTIFPFLIENKNEDLLLKLLEIIIKPRKSKEPFSLETTSIMEEYWFSEVLKKNKRKLVEICGLKSARIVIKQMKSILKEEESSFNIATIPTIEDSSQIMFPEKYEWQLVSLLRETLEQAIPPSQADLLSEMLQSQFSIFKRIGIHTINYHYQAFANLFWSWKDNPLEEFRLKHEIYELLKSNKQYFSEEEFNKLIEWIEAIKLKPSKTTPEDTESLKKREAYVKLEWLSAVADTENKQIRELHQKYFQIYPGEIEHPGYIVWSSGVQVSKVGDVQPFSEEILSLSNQKIAEYIMNYREPEKKRFELNGNLRYSLSRTVRENPQKFVKDMKPFLALKYEYQEAFLSGLLEAWKNDEKFSWKELFDYMLALISRADFWVQGKKPENTYKKWVISRIADLIYSGTNNDKHAFDSKHFPECERVLLILGEETKSELDDTTEDVLTATLNSSLGRVYSAMVSYSLRVARLLKKATEQKWVDNIKMHFEKTLETERSIEFDVTLGTFLPQLSFLDENWVRENINRIFPKENEKSWANGFSSYLFHSSHFSKELYCLLRENQHYKLAMKTKFKKSVASAKVSQHIFIAYLHEVEPLSDGSLLSDLIMNENTNYLLDLVRFAWRLRDKINEKTKTRIKPLWGKIVAFVASSDDESKYREILANLSYWLSLVDEIDENICRWMKTSGKYIDQRTELFFVEYLLEHVSKTPQFVAEIFYEIVSTQRYFPRYRKEDIVGIVKKLFEFGQVEKAKRICNLYLESGYLFLREIYDEYKDS